VNLSDSIRETKKMQVFEREYTIMYDRVMCMKYVCGV